MNSPRITVHRDPLVKSGARAEGTLLVPSTPDIVAVGFESDTALLVSLITATGRELVPAVTMDRFGGGLTHKASLACTSQLVRSWLDGKGGDTSLRIGLRNARGWIAFAEVDAERMPVPPVDAGS